MSLPDVHPTRRELCHRPHPVGAVVNAIRTRRLLPPVLLVLLACSLNPTTADFDINSVEGRVRIDGKPAPAGTGLAVRCASGVTVYCDVDGPNVAPWEKGQGMYRTADVPQFNTGERIWITPTGLQLTGSETAILVAGTTVVDLEAKTNMPPVVFPIPRQSGLESRPWVLDLSAYVSDPDTPMLNPGATWMPMPAVTRFIPP